MSFEFQLSLLLSFLSFFSFFLFSFLLFSLFHFHFYSFFFSYSPVKYFMATLVGFLISTSIFQFTSSLPFHFLILFHLNLYLIYLLFLLISSDSNIITLFFSLYICHSRDFHLIPTQFLIFILLYFS